MSVRHWPAIDIQQPGACSDPDGLEGAILAALDDAGVSAVQELPFGWRIFFTTTGSREAAMATLANWKPELVVSALDISDEDWARRSQENLGPVCVGRVRIAPPWLANAEATRDEARSNPDAVIDIVILPSMGFGTGHHATTRLCAALLQQIDLSGRRVLDVGTGSGVLAIVGRAPRSRVRSGGGRRSGRAGVGSREPGTEWDRVRQGRRFRCCRTSAS